MNEFPQPATVRDLRKFREIINFYRRFIPNATKHQAALSNYLKGSERNDKNLIQWTEESIRAFELDKQQICSVVSFCHPCAHLPLAVMVDASNTTVGA
ncbi:transposon Tf2-6 polyprotein [Nephila pilipes]|uniref:Transposon Tf2-6 polyprotein n=1 Tax=Nephila pilipes TaxID=299642 RepID=A0A8X6T8H1_NEPPI|nr:transposon Tf2-6 polyprotein [Nephila pilipes]